MAKTFARLDQVTLGAQLELLQGNAVVTFDTDGANLNRNARSNQGVATGKWYWETIYGGTISAVGNIVTGVVTSAVLNSDPVGGVAETYGFKAADGIMRGAGADVATTVASANQGVIGHAMDLDSGTQTLSILLNNLPLYTFNLPAGKTWYPAISIGGSKALLLSALVNLGKRVFENTPPDGFRPGIYIDDVGISFRVAAPKEFLTAPTDSPPNTRYVGRVKNPRNFGFTTGGRPWPYGDRGITASFSDLDLDNQDGYFDDLIANPPRGSDFEARMIGPGDTFLTPTAKLVAIFDGVSAPDKFTCRIRLRSILTKYKVPLRRKTYTPFVAAGAANQVVPISLGGLRNVTGVLKDAASNSYDLHDDQLTNIASIRDMGDKLDPDAIPPDWTALSTGTGFSLNVPPQGKTTADISSQGSNNLHPPPGSDALNGNGTFATASGGAGSMPTNMVARIIDDGAHMTMAQVATDGGRLDVRVTGNVAAISRRWRGQFEDMATSRNFVAVRKGVTYKVSFDIKAASWVNPPQTVIGQTALQMNLCSPSKDGYDISPQIIWSQSTSVVPGTYSAAFKADRDGVFEVFAQVIWDISAMTLNGTWPGLPLFIQYDNVKCEAVTPVPADVLNGYGNMLTGLTNWTNDGTSAGCSVVQLNNVISTLTMGQMHFAVAAGAGKIARYRFDAGTGANLLHTKHYRVAFFTLGSSSNAVMKLINKTSGGDVVIASWSGISNTTAEASFIASADGYLVLEAHTSDALVGDYYVAFARALDVTAQDAAAVPNQALPGITLKDFFFEILEKRHLASSSDYDVADLTAIDTATGYSFGWHSAAPVNVDDALQSALDSYCACLADGGDGRLRVSRFIAPETALDADIEFFFDRTNMIGAPQPQDADAVGLTTNGYCQLNNTDFDDSDFVTDYSPVTGIDAATREQFKRPGQIIVASSVDLHPMYRDAQDAGPFNFLFDEGSYAQTEIDRVDGVFVQARRVFRLIGKTDGVPPALRFGSIVHCTHTRYGFATGKKLFVLEATRYIFGRRIEVLAVC